MNAGARPHLHVSCDYPTTCFSPSPPCYPVLSLLVFGSPPYRVTRTIKSPLPAESGKGGRLEEGAEVAGDASGSSGGGGGGECAAQKEGGVGCGVDVGGVGDDYGVVGGVDVGGGGDAAAGGSERFITAVISLTFVAPPGHAAPDSQTMEYRLDLFSRQGSQEVAVFLGEVDYNGAG